MMEPRPHVVVLGAGVCGLYAARVLAAKGLAVTVLEREEEVGGLAAGRERAGNYYDFGVHHLHAFDTEIFDDLKQLMGDRMVSVPKLALIRYGSGYRRYPLEFFDLLTGIPPWTLSWSVIGLVVQQLHNRLRPRETHTAEQALIQLYGRPLYRFFFRDFTHRYWGIPPRELSATFVRKKMPRLSAVDVLKKALGRLGVASNDDAVESATKEEQLYYSRTGARELPLTLAATIERLGGRVLTSSQVVGIELKGQPRVPDEPDPMSGDGAPLRIAAVRYVHQGATHRLTCDAVLSTIPLPALVAAYGDNASSAIREAACQLRYKPVAVYGFLVRRPRVLTALYVYYRNRIFHRLAEPALSGMEVRPAGHTVLLAETTCDVGDDRWVGGEATRRQMIADLEAEGLLAGDDIVETHVFTNEYAYPVYGLGFEPHLAAVESFLARFANLRSTGRQGGFCYPNMHGAMRMGATAAAELAALLLGTAIV